MIETAHGRRKGRIPRGLLGMLALVVAVESTIAARRLDFTLVWTDDWRNTAEVASSRVRDREVLFFGDSLIKYGVLPKVIEARTGLRTYNLAVNAGTMPSTYFLLRRALESGARPKAIVADFFALMKHEDPHWRVRGYAELATARDCVELSWTARDARLLAETLGGKLLPSYRCRYQIRDSVTAALQGRRSSPWPEQSAVWATWEAQDGAQPMPMMPWGFAYDPALHASLLLEHWSCDPFHAAFIEKFLALAASKDIPVFWLMPPFSPRVHEGRRPLGTDDAYRQLAREAQRRYPNVVVLDAKDSGYDDSVYIDVMHLEYRGARVLSSDLATILADRIRRPGRASADRWVDLPRFAGRNGDEPSREVASEGRPAAR